MRNQLLVVLALLCLSLPELCSGLRIPPSLTEKTLWKMNLVLQKEGFKRVEATARVRFIETPGYEPPSGRLFVEDDFNGLIRVNDAGYACNWGLSEDKEDRKDGLWIWGLFETPKYPFLYMNLNIFDSFFLPSGEEDKIPWDIPGSCLYCRFNHVNDKETGVTLDDATMTYQLDEFTKADPFGVGGSVKVGDFVPAGTITLTAVNESLERLS